MHASSHLFLKAVVCEVVDLYCPVSTSHRESLCVHVECHGTDGTGHVVEEPHPVHFEFPHCHLGRKTYNVEIIM